MKLNEFIDGIAILRKHYTDPNGFHLGAEHDIIYLYPTDTPLSLEELTELEKLGWHQPERAESALKAMKEKPDGK